MTPFYFLLAGKENEPIQIPESVIPQSITNELFGHSAGEECLIKHRDGEPMVKIQYTAGGAVDSRVIFVSSQTPADIYLLKSVSYPAEPKDMKQTLIGKIIYKAK